MHVYDLLPVYNTCHKNIINVKYKANGISIRQAAIKAKQNKNKIKTNIYQQFHMKQYIFFKN